MRIWKYPVEITDSQIVMMPHRAKILDVQMQHRQPCIWVLCDETPQILEAREFAIYGTGNEMPDDPGTYIGTFQTQGGSLVFHMFEPLSGD